MKPNRAEGPVPAPRFEREPDSNPRTGTGDEPELTPEPGTRTRNP